MKNKTAFITFSESVQTRYSSEIRLDGTIYYYDKNFNASKPRAIFLNKQIVSISKGSELTQDEIRMFEAWAVVLLTNFKIRMKHGYSFAAANVKYL